MKTLLRNFALFTAANSKAEVPNVELTSLWKNLGQKVSPMRQFWSHPMAMKDALFWWCHVPGAEWPGGSSRWPGPSFEPQFLIICQWFQRFQMPFPNFFMAKIRANHRQSSVCSTATHHRGIWRIRLIEIVGKSYDVQFELWPDFMLQHRGCWMWHVWPRDLHHVGHVPCQTAQLHSSIRWSGCRWFIVVHADILQILKQILVEPIWLWSVEHTTSWYISTLSNVAQISLIRI